MSEYSCSGLCCMDPQYNITTQREDLHDVKDCHVLS